MAETENEGFIGADISVTLRRQLMKLTEDLKEIRDQGKRAATDPNEVALFKGMRKSHQTIFEKFEKFYDDLCDLTDDSGQNSVATAQDHAVRSRAKRYLHEINAFGESMDKPDTNASTMRPSTFCSGGHRSKAKLQALTVPTFKGDRTKWPRFRDLFESMVIEDPDYRDIDRFHHLVALVEGPAAAIVANVKICEANFVVAWNALKNNYDNQRLLANAYLDTILNINPLTRKPSTEELVNLISKLSEAVASYNLLSIPDSNQFVFFHIARRCLDPQTQEAFELHNKKEFPSFNELISFLRDRCTASELLSSSTPKTSNPRARNVSLYTNSNNHNDLTKSNLKRTSHQPNKSCTICQGQHPLVNCLKFNNTPPPERSNLLQNWKGCRNCLQDGHFTRNCSSRWRCRFCKGNHHSMLHVTPNNANKWRRPEQSHPNKVLPGPSTSSDYPENKQLPNTFGRNMLLSRREADTMLGTAVCLIKDNKGEYQPVRVVIDSGSQFSFITNSCAKRLGLKIKPDSTTVQGLGETPLQGFSGHVTCSLFSRVNNFCSAKTKAIVIDIVTSPLPGFTTPSHIWEPYQNYTLADPEFWITNPVDFLVGCNLFNTILSGPVVTIDPGMPKLIGTYLGFIVLGQIQDSYEANRIYNVLHAHATPSDSALLNDLKRLWELEEPVIPKPTNPDDETCEELYKNTYYRLDSGRYVVRLPFKIAKPQFGETRGQAMRRLMHLETRLTKSPFLREKYNSYMREYVDLGHMSLAKNPGKFFIPHHCVLKGEGDEAKIRVVFDASARSSTGSLNDALLTGPKLQNNLVTILLNFRCHRYAFVVDIVKMFRQILLHPDDCVYQHLLWRFNPSDAIQEYEANTVSFGQVCAPYLALRTIKQLLLDEGGAYPIASASINEDMYVDDLVTGSSTLESALELKHQVTELLGKGGFPLSKWASNHPDLRHINNDDSDLLHPVEPIIIKDSDQEESVKILGLQWHPLIDAFTYKIAALPTTCNKRTVLSMVARMYDPLGFLGPTIMLAKELIQEAWKRSLSWDTPFPKDLQERWCRIVEDLPNLKYVQIKRWIVPNSTTETRILIFADASERAYCASAYLYTLSALGPQMNLVMAKTKLAPVKVTTIPRLELCATLLAARLWQSLQSFCSKLPQTPQVHFFTDSSVVLSWLRTPSFKLKTFVANRVVTIRNITSDHWWRHVPSESNPSDLGTKGLLPSELIDNSLWFHGPPWAIADPITFPSSLTTSPASIPELKPVVGHTLLSTQNSYWLVEWCEGFSSFTRLVRSMAASIRFCDMVSTKRPLVKGPYSLFELRFATVVLVNATQCHYFFNGRIPNDKTELPKQLLSLHPFLDDSGTLLVGGRLRNANLSWTAKHPMILPSHSHLAKLIMEHYHRALLHSGPNSLLAHLRLKYWITGGRKAVRGVTRACVNCRRFDAPLCKPLMGDLPSHRLKEGRAFLHVGVDFAGPFYIKESLRRNASSHKAYLCLFICLSTRALHLELVTGLSTPAFCASLDRFIHRRGLPERIVSDNGTNFVGAANYLGDLYRWYRKCETQDSIKTYAALHEIKFCFQPPHAPHFGGSWERAVRSVKRLMRSVYGDNKLTYEELDTLLIKIEGTLNSRPLCALSDDPTDLDYLTPGHFLIGAPVLAVPERTLIEVSENRLTRWQLVHQKAQHFWQRWRKEYITSLQERAKWRKPSANLKVGDLVLMQEDHAPRLCWPVGRIEIVHPGKDEVVRVATVKTSSATLKRPVHKLIPLFNDGRDPIDCPAPLLPPKVYN